MGLDDGAGTHIAGLERYIEITVEEVPGGEFPAGLGDTDHLGVKRRVLFGLAQIMGTGNDPPVFYNDTSDR